MDAFASTTLLLAIGIFVELVSALARYCNLVNAYENIRGRYANNQYGWNSFFLSPTIIVQRLRGYRGFCLKYVNSKLTHDDGKNDSHLAMKFLPNSANVTKDNL